MSIQFNSIQPIFFGRFIQENDNFVVVSNFKKIIFKKISKRKKRMLVNIFSLSDGTNTVRNIISKFSSSEYRRKEILDLLKYLIRQKILVDSREIFLQFHPYVENLTSFYYKLSKEKIKSMLREIDELKYNGSRVRMSRFPISQFCELIGRRRTIRDFDEQKTISLQDLSGILYSAYGVSKVTKISGVKVFKRVVPSAGALYPLHLFCIILKKIESVCPGVYYLNKKSTILRLTKIHEISGYEPLKEFIVNHEEIIKRASLLLVIACNFKKVSQKYSNRGYMYGLFFAKILPRRPRPQFEGGVLRGLTLNFDNFRSGGPHSKAFGLLRGKQKARIFVHPVGKRSFSFGARPHFSAAEFCFLLRKKRRKKRCCPCPSPPVRGQQEGTPFLFYTFIKS